LLVTIVVASFKLTPAFIAVPVFSYGSYSFTLNTTQNKVK